MCKRRSANKTKPSTGCVRETPNDKNEASTGCVRETPQEKKKKKKEKQTRDM